MDTIEQTRQLPKGSHTALTDFLKDNYRLVVIMVVAFALAGAAYALFSKPVYQSNILIQLEEGAKPSNALAELTNLFDLKTGATTEMEVLRSRLVVGAAVDRSHAFIETKPKRFPVIGMAISRFNKGLTNPGFLGAGGYVWGAEHAEVSTFLVPAPMEGKTFTLVRGADDQYVLRQNDLGISAHGRIDHNLEVDSPHGRIVLHVDRFDAKPGAEYTVIRNSQPDEIDTLQKALHISEKGKQSGIIKAELEDTDPKRVATVLEAIGQEYIRQANERRSDEAKRSLEFLHGQLPGVKQELERSEQRYNTMRSQSKIPDFTEENRSVSQQETQAMERIAELTRRKEELLARFTSEHPIVQSVTQQIRQAESGLARLNERRRDIPKVEQDVGRLEREVKVNSALYTSLLSSSQQLRLLPPAKGGNIRLLDHALVPSKPIKPNAVISTALGTLFGLIFGLMVALCRRSLVRGISRPHEIDQSLAVRVVATLPHSSTQAKLETKARATRAGKYLLAEEVPFDPVVEALRGMRTVMQHLQHRAKNNVVLITGATKEVGKSFVSANLAAVMGSFGMRVLLIDADFRAGQLHRYLGRPQEPGMTAAMTDRASLSTVLQRDIVENVDMITAGREPNKPAEMLAHQSFGHLLQSLCMHYDVVLIDSPPILATPDAAIIGAHAGTIFCVARAGRSTIEELEEAVVRLNQAGLAMTGVVFNDTRSSHAYSYSSKADRQSKPIAVAA